MVRFEVAVEISASPETVDQALMIPENAPYWNTDLIEFEVVKGPPGMVGAVGRLHYSQDGKEHIMEDVLEQAEPGRRYVSRVSGPAIEARIETVISPIDGGTRLVVTWDGRGKRLLVSLILPFLRRRMVHRTGEELRTFKELVETRGATFGRD